MEFLTNNWSEILVVVSAALGALSMIATVIAPLTDTKIDDKAVGVLGVLKGLVDRLKLSK